MEVDYLCLLPGALAQADRIAPGDSLARVAAVDFLGRVPVLPASQDYSKEK